MAFTRLLRNLLRDGEFGKPRSCRSCPTKPARSAWTRCSASSRSTPRRARSTSRSTTTCCCPTPRPRTGRSSRRASPRPARCRRGRPPRTSYAHRGVPMVPFFIFYSMFGFQRVGDLIWAAADARVAGLPARRHRRAHHAARRGPAAPGRPLAAPGVDRARRARSTTRRSPTRWPPSSSTASQRMYGGEPSVPSGVPARTSSTTSPSTTRTTRCRPGPSNVSIDDVVSGPVPVRADRPRRSPAADGAPAPRATILFSGSAQGAGPRGAGRPGRAPTACAAELWSATSYKRLREDGAVRRALEPPAPGATTADGRPRSPPSSPRPAGPIVAVTDFMKAVPDQIAAVRARRPPRSSPSAPTASVAATPARRSAASSRPTLPTSTWPCSRRWRPPVRCPPRRWPGASIGSASTPMPPTPACGDGAGDGFGRWRSGRRWACCSRATLRQQELAGRNTPSDRVHPPLVGPRD